VVVIAVVEVVVEAVADYRDYIRPFFFLYRVKKVISKKSKKIINPIRFIGLI